MYVVSACLCGINCRYDGGGKLNEKIESLLREGKVIPVCPEQLGGMSTPRHPSEIVEGTAADVLNGKGKVVNDHGEDVTENFVKGARETLKIALASGCKRAILKANSPSCGSGQVYNGKFNGTLTAGNGITAQLLSDNGIEVITEKDI